MTIDRKRFQDAMKVLDDQVSAIENRCIGRCVFVVPEHGKFAVQLAIAWRKDNDAPHDPIHLGVHADEAEAIEHANKVRRRLANLIRLHRKQILEIIGEKP